MLGGKTVFSIQNKIPLSKQHKQPQLRQNRKRHLLRQQSLQLARQVPLDHFNVAQALLPQLQMQLDQMQVLIQEVH
jgi:hypothetical protein